MVAVSIVIADVRFTPETERKRGLAVLVLWLCLLTSFTLTLLTDDDVPEVVEAARFVVRDERGTIRAGLMMEQNEPVLFFADTSGKRISQYK
ncbi:MAG: hypothetical protein EAZ92_09005 [Candidatus Kapaibacterium sp.]|nr:MAG: hypothetical protein EAZ92_09005 [Candidatus Kapabacteria bacterium]